MASYRKRGDKWEAALCLNGVRRSGTFATKREAVAWAAAQSVTLKEEQANGGIPDISVSKLLQKYLEEVTPRKRGYVNETNRIKRLMRDDLARIHLPVLKTAHLAAWRDRRLSVVSSASARRDFNLLSHVFTVAVREWGYFKENPIKGIKKPVSPPPRDRRITDAEIARLLLGFGYSREGIVKTSAARVAVAFLFAIETGMRAGEICGLRWEAIRGNVAHLPITKNGFPRMVPLSTEAVRLLGQLPKDAENKGSVFKLATSQLDPIFRRVRRRAMIDDLHFHDTRHEAITRLARKLDVLDLARMVGTRDLKILMVYYNATASEIAARLG